MIELPDNIESHGYIVDELADAVGDLSYNEPGWSERSKERIEEIDGVVQRIKGAAEELRSASDELRSWLEEDDN